MNKRLIPFFNTSLKTRFLYNIPDLKKNQAMKKDSGSRRK